MRPLAPGLILVGLVIGSSPAYATTNVSVSFIEPARFTDAESARRESDEPLQGITKHLQWLGEHYLPPEQALKVEVLDVDLAGRYRFLGRSHQYVRVVDGGVDWPQIKVRFVLESSGQILQRGEELISDMGYTQHTNTYGVNDTLRYEKLMLDRWFKARFIQ